MDSRARKTWLVWTALLAVAASGCASSASESSLAVPTAPTSTADDAMLGVTEHHRHHHHGGATLFIAMSLDTLGVSPDQRGAVEKIRSELHARMEPARVAEQTLTAALADGVAAASFDTAVVDSAVSHLAAAARAVPDASAGAMNELHALLTPVQRAALVDKVEAHWAIWQKANAGQGDRLTALADDLALTADQVEGIRASLGVGMSRSDPEQGAAHLRAFGEAFRSETFDARALAGAGSADESVARLGAAHMASFVEAVSPQLTPEQRARFADRLRLHAAHDPSARVSP